jgi:dethiobiotin synthetase
MRRDPTSPGLIITGTGTNVGKTVVARALTRALVARGLRVGALKPFETGVVANPEDAVALACACGRPELAHAPGLYRAVPPLAPFSVELSGGRACNPDAIADAVRSAVAGSEVAIIEGVGGIAVPLTRTALFADFAAALGWPVMLVARDELGVLSHVLSALEIASARKLDVELIALGRSSDADVSTNTNAAVLTELVAPSVRAFAIDDERSMVNLLEALTLGGLQADSITS